MTGNQVLCSYLPPAPLSAYTALALGAGWYRLQSGLVFWEDQQLIITLGILSINDIRMKRAFQIAQNHPISVISYILYTFFCYIVIDYMIKSDAAFENIQLEQQVNWGGQGELFGFIFIVLFAIILIVAMILNALLRKTNQSFYWWDVLNDCILTICRNWVQLFITCGLRQV